MKNTILVVEDDNDLREYLKELLQENNYSVQTAPDGLSAINSIKKSEPNLVLLDLGLPNISGESVTMEIRKKHPKLPIVILTAKDSVSDVIHGLDLGADDYIAKPFVGDELLARIKARLRHENRIENKIKVGDLELNTKTLEVKRGSKLIKLTAKEFRLLEYLMRNKGQILSREMILNRIWNYSFDIETRVVDIYIGYLRKKIDSGYEKKLIHSIRGFGYTIKEGKSE